MVALNTKDTLGTIKMPYLGLEPSESYEQLIDSLVALDNALEDVFGRVERRVARERAKLRGIEKRIDAASHRARGITGSLNATVVFSAARYPAPPRPQPFERLFYDDAKLMAAAEEAIAVPLDSRVEPPEAVAERRGALDRSLKLDAQPMAECAADPKRPPRTRTPPLASERPVRPAGTRPTWRCDRSSRPTSRRRRSGRSRSRRCRRT